MITSTKTPSLGMTQSPTWWKMAHRSWQTLPICVSSTRGAHGGYTLAKPATEITLKEIVDILEGDICLVDCVKNPYACSRSGTCASRDLWPKMSDRISQTLDAITLDELVRMSREKGEGTAMYHI